MKLLRVTVANFRSLAQPVELTLPESGLCVIVGSNEEGKSTLVDAVRTVFFERHRVSGKTALSMLPFGSKVQPQISVDFSINGDGYSISKTFVQRPSARLETPNGVFEGDDAERQLQTLLRTQMAARGSSKAEHQGVWGLLWVQQGRTYEPVVAEGTARHTLQSHLENEVGDVLAGDVGVAVLEKVRTRVRGYYNKNGSAREELKHAQDRVTQLEHLQHDLDVSLQTFEAEVEQLADALKRQEASARKDALGEAAKLVEEAQGKHAQVAALREAVEKAKQRLEVAEAQLKHRQALHVQRQELVATCEQRTADLKKRAVVADELQVTQRDALAKQKTADERCAAEQQALDDARARFADVERLRDAAETSARRTAAKKRLRRAQKHQKALDDVLAQIDAISIDAAGLRALEDAQHAVAHAQARLDAAATMLTIEMPDHEVFADDTPQPQGKPLHLTETTVIRVKGVGTISVTPGGEDVADRRRQLHDAKAALRRRLADLEFDNLQSARNAWDQKHALASEVRTCERQLLIDAPESIEVLSQTVDQLQTALTEQLAALGMKKPPGPVEVELKARQLGATLERHAEAHRQALADKEQTATRVTAIGAQLSEAKANLVAREEEVRELKARLATARENTPDAALETNYLDVAATREAHRRELAEAQVELAATHPQDTALMLQNAKTRHAQLSRESEQLARSIEQARIKLAASGAAELGEQHQETTEALEQARTELTALTEDAQASLLLLRVLEDAEREAKDGFVAPLAKRLAPMLNKVMLDSSLMLDEDLRVRGLVRNGHDEPFASLSIGTREQLAVLTRLAFADILRTNGQEVPILLDDALVYSDEARFSAMKEILVAHAQTQQVLVLTCRQRDWNDVDATIVQLENARLVAPDEQVRKAPSSEDLENPTATREPHEPGEIHGTPPEEPRPRESR